MRLLNTSNLRLEFFPSSEVPKYAILSHTWGNEEVSYEDLVRGIPLAHLSGWDKIYQSSLVAAKLGFGYIWIDTCCIDKASSAELSEAINSMFRWYEQARVCIAILSDVSTADDATAPGSEFRESRWFTRGWTLQELIAPCEVIFYNQKWKVMGTRTSLTSVLRSITSLPEELLNAQTVRTTRRRRSLDGFPVAQKMSWAAKRVTTRAEDIAYCLLGIFDINMPLLYGEGEQKAFKRLQEEVIKSTDDDSIYAWTLPRGSRGSGDHEQDYWGLLAESPADFGNSSDLIPSRPKYLTRRSNYTTVMSNRGLRIEFALTPFPEDLSHSIFFAYLDCELRMEGSKAHMTPAIILQRSSWDNDSDFVRIRPDMLALSMMNRIVMPDELANMLKELSHDDIISEAIPRQIFVPHDYTVTRSPSGIVFHPEIQRDGRQLSTEITVKSRSPTWHHFDHSTQEPIGSYEINFDVTQIPEGSDLEAPKMLGFIEFEWAANSTGTVMSKLSLRHMQRACIVTGIEPPPKNPFDTPPLYFVPWCAFDTAENIATGFQSVLQADTRKSFYIGKDSRLTASIDLQSRKSRMFYGISMEAEAWEEPDMKRRTWLPSSISSMSLS